MRSRRRRRSSRRRWNRKTRTRTEEQEEEMVREKREGVRRRRRGGSRRRRRRREEEEAELPPRCCGGKGVGERKRSREKGAGGVTRGKSPRAIFPHIIIREGLGVSMVTTHHPLLAHPCAPTYIHPLIHSAPRLLICRRTRIGTHTHTHTRSLMCAC